MHTYTRVYSREKSRVFDLLTSSSARRRQCPCIYFHIQHIQVLNYIIKLVKNPSNGVLSTSSARHRPPANFDRHSSCSPRVRDISQVRLNLERFDHINLNNDVCTFLAEWDRFRLKRGEKMRLASYSKKKKMG
jgi:hypothetical protein